MDDASAVALAMLRGDPLDDVADRLPVPPVSDRWLARLGDSPAHWWRDLALAVNHQLRGDASAARTPTRPASPPGRAPWPSAGSPCSPTTSTRLSCTTNGPGCSTPGSRALATELLNLLIGSGRPDHALRVIGALPGAVRRHGRTRLLEAVALADAGRETEARAIMDDVEVPDLAEGARDLGDLWVRLHPDQPIPQRLDFRMHDEGART